jgi:hypothetical protein
MMAHLFSLGSPITDTEVATPVYNNNKDCVKWCHNMTTKGICHIEHQENAVKEWVKDGSIMSRTLVANAIHLTSLQKKCKTVTIFDAFVTPS